MRTLWSPQTTARTMSLVSSVVTRKRIGFVMRTHTEALFETCFVMVYESLCKLMSLIVNILIREDISMGDSTELTCDNYCRGRIDEIQSSSGTTPI